MGHFPTEEQQGRPAVARAGGIRMKHFASMEEPFPEDISVSQEEDQARTVKAEKLGCDCISGRGVLD